MLLMEREEKYRRWLEERSDRMSHSAKTAEEFWKEMTPPEGLFVDGDADDGDDVHDRSHVHSVEYVTQILARTKRKKERIHRSRLYRMSTKTHRKTPPSRPPKIMSTNGS